MRGKQLKMSAAERMLIIFNCIVAVIFFSDVFFPDPLIPQWVISWAGVKVSIILILNFLFIFFWLYRIRYFFLISLVSIFAYTIFMGLQYGWEDISDNIVKVIMMPDESETEIVKNYIGNNVKLKDHPRLWLTEEDVSSIKSSIKLNKDWANVNKIIIDEADLILTTKIPVYTSRGAQFIENTGGAYRRLLFLTYAWRTTNQKKYLNAAVEDLLSFASVKDWRPTTFLGTSEITIGMSMAYDALYPNLSESNRFLISRSIISKGLKPSLDSYYNTWLNENTEKNQICNSAMIYSALAVYENDSNLAKTIINRSIGSMKSKLPYLYSPNGVYYSGYQLGMMGSTYCALAIDALKNSFKSEFDLTEGNTFLKSGEYFEHMLGPSGVSYNYSDPMPQSDLKGINYLTPNPFLYWLSKNLDKPPLNPTSHYILTHGSFEDFSKNKFLPLTVNWGSKVATTSAHPPTKNMFVEHGTGAIALMRTSWDNKAIYIGLKAGTPSNSGGHMDIGSFVLDAQGKRWVTELGGDDVVKLESRGVNIYDMSANSKRWNIFRNNTESHSNLTVNNGHQQIKAVADITEFSDKSDFMYAITDLTKSYSELLQTAKRGVAIVNHKYVQIYDEIETLPIQNSIRWKIMTPASVKILSDNIAELTQGEKKYYMRVVKPAKVKLETWSTRPGYQYEASNPNQTLLGFKFITDVKRKEQIAVIFSEDYNFIQNTQSPEALSKWSKY